MSRKEADTRAELIDPKLKQNGWGIVEDSYIRREVICPGRIISGNKRGTTVDSDYVLSYQGRKLAVVEAKQEKLSYTEGVRQAKDYATRLKCRIAYATNGHEIYQMDMVTGDESLVDDYMSPEQLWDCTFGDSGSTIEPGFASVWRRRFAGIPFDTKSGSWTPRYYQENAINAALEVVAQGGNRILLTLATGTGKTAISFQIAWKLFNSRWSLSSQKTPDEGGRKPRVLFLADRNILADQAFNDFGAFGDNALARIDPKEISKKGRVPKNASVFFTIFQTFMSGKDDEGNDAPYFGEYPADFFDFIIIDECHRGGANDESTWREVLEHFSPAVQLGLTATPKREDNADTYKYFGDPVYSYTLKEGINDGFLTPFKVHPIVGTMDEYLYTPGDGVIVEGEPEPGHLYKEGDFNRIITIPEREQKRVQYWMDKINPREKTIVFCGTQQHAGMVRDYINQYATKQGWSNNSNYCVRVTATDGAAGETDLKIFQDNEKTIPTILTTSRKLSTGVDARNVRNIVLMRPCNNMIEFKQIIGRGTRVYEGKDFFTVYDFVKAHYNFADPEWDGEPLEPVTPDDTVSYRPSDDENEKSPRPDMPSDDDSITIEKIVIKLSDGKTREIKHISSVMYWSSDGKPITGKEFLERMFDDLPQFFENEDQLRAIWSHPETRENLLANLREAGYDDEKLDGMKDLIDAKDSDVYDVLANVAYARQIRTRTDRVNQAVPAIKEAFTDINQLEFIEFVLEKYVEDGVKELAKSKMNSLVKLKYDNAHDAVAVLGSPGIIKETFAGFQKYLYL
jgi:type I restriction enzyme R subunit